MLCHGTACIVKEYEEQRSKVFVLAPQAYRKDQPTTLTIIGQDYFEESAEASPLKSDIRSPRYFLADAGVVNGIPEVCVCRILDGKIALV